ncbi:MAG: C-terminal processing protease CtpA/Prc [Polaribacter sp.]|jgi:C-terminal processing protease CtpA/Prc
MKYFFKFLCLSVFISTFANCSKEYEIPQELVVHDFVWKGLNAYYLHQNQIADLDDKRFNSDQQLETYLNAFTDYNALYAGLLISSDVKSTIVEDYNTIISPELRTRFTHGLEFGLFKEQDSDTIIGYALDILPLSYASDQNISRGDYFYAIINEDNDTINLSENNYEDLLLDYTQDTLKLVMIDYEEDINGYNGTLNSKKTELIKKNYTYKPINIQNTILDNGNNIGYLSYNNDFSRNYIKDLNTTFLEFKNQNINELILDLRYNIGGGSFAKNISEISSMITGQFTNEILIKEKWNTKAQPWFLANQPDSLVTKFPESLNTITNINSLNLTDVHIILNGNGFTGSSAVELLINSLKSHINVHIIGNQTAGNNTGSITLYNSVDYDFFLRNSSHTVALQPIVLNFLNKDDQTYENGFSPNISLCTNEDALDLGVLGETSDPILNRVLDYISTGNTGASETCNPYNFEYLFNSINTQREIDNGVFIHQDLPNTI